MWPCPIGFGMVGFPIFGFFFMGLFFVIGIAVFIIIIITIVDILKRDALDTLEKILWILVVWFLGIIGAIIYYLLSKRNSKSKGDNNAKILVVTDGAYGYRIKGTINSFGKKNKFIGIYKINKPDDLIVDDIEFPDELLEKIKEADILLLYTQHPDNTYYLCYEARRLNKDIAIIVATWSGEGEKKELKKFDAICPEEMCLLDENEVGSLIDKYPN